MDSPLMDSSSNDQLLYNVLHIVTVSTVFKRFILPNVDAVNTVQRTLWSSRLRRLWTKFSLWRDPKNQQIIEVPETSQTTSRLVWMGQKFLCTLHVTCLVQLVCSSRNLHADPAKPSPRLTRASVIVAVMVLHSLGRNGENVGARLAGTLPTCLLYTSDAADE